MPKPKHNRASFDPQTGTYSFPRMPTNAGVLCDPSASSERHLNEPKPQWMNRDPSSSHKERVSLDTLYELMGDKKNSYCLMIEYGYYLPEFTAPIITRDYMLDIITGRTWCPKSRDVQFVRPVSGISKEKLVGEIVSLRPETRLKCYQEADKEWLTAVLACLDPQHPIFRGETDNTASEKNKKIMMKLLKEEKLEKKEWLEEKPQKSEKMRWSQRFEPKTRSQTSFSLKEEVENVGKLKTKQKIKAEKETLNKEIVLGESEANGYDYEDQYEEDTRSECQKIGINYERLAEEHEPLSWVSEARESPGKWVQSGSPQRLGSGETMKINGVKPLGKREEEDEVGSCLGDQMEEEESISFKKGKKIKEEHQTQKTQDMMKIERKEKRNVKGYRESSQESQNDQDNDKFSNESLGSASDSGGSIELNKPMMSTGGSPKKSQEFSPMANQT